tara:strand:+ start:204 stop:446 length:243 start_codon:yes stop_codon:yes gene_type:complete
MTSTQWKPDTCDCVIEYDNKTLKLTNETKRCKLHKNSSSLLKDIRKHNKSFNLKFGSDPTKEQLKQISELKQKEKKKSRK